MQMSFKRLLVLAISMICLTGVLGLSADKAELSVSITIDDALLTARKYMGENRIYAGNFLITSATLHDETKNEKPYWEIILRKKREGSQVNQMILRVYMDKSVDRVVSKNAD